MEDNMETKENQVSIPYEKLRSLIACETTLDILGAMLSEKYPDADLMRRILGVRVEAKDV
jgi:hypothetical protein